MRGAYIICGTNLRSNSARRRIAALFLIAAILLISHPTQSQIRSTDVQLHKFQPSITPEESVSANQLNANQAITAPQAANGIAASAVQQILALQKEKSTRTPAQQKIDSNLLYTVRMMAGQPAAPGVASLYTGIELDAQNRIAVDLTAYVTDELLQQLRAAGAQVIYTNQWLRGIRAMIPPRKIEALAASPDVIFISPKQNFMTRGQKNDQKSNSTSSSQQNAPLISPPNSQATTERLRKQIISTGVNFAGMAQLGQGSVETEGDLTHRAYDARKAFGVDGSPLRIGVLSDGVTSLAEAQTTGDLPPPCGAPPCVTILNGQVGTGDEGSAMLEIIHDMAPGASLYFATAGNSIASFAQNVRALRIAGCDIIVDDVLYFAESPFQNGQTLNVISSSQGGAVTQAVEDVVTDGAYYFSAAGNEGNEDLGTSGTYEGDFHAAPDSLSTGHVHDFGGGTGYNSILSFGTQTVGLYWADPLGGSANDYDLYILDSTGSTVLAASTNIQNGKQDPLELVSDPNITENDRVVVYQNTKALNRFFHLELFRGRLNFHTAGETHGHSAASAAYTIAATPAAVAPGNSGTNGPSPNPFNANSRVEFYSSDGPRRVFFRGDSSPVTQGNFSATGGTILNKPNLTAADGVSVTGAGGKASPLYGSSAAAAAAASIAALVLAADPAITPRQLLDTLTGTAVDIMAPGYDRDSGSGIMMAWEAIKSRAVPVHANLELGLVTASENPGNGNGTIERGEGAILMLPLNNKNGQQGATGITATLTTANPKVYITQPAVSRYPDMPAGSSDGRNLSPFTFTLDPNFPCGGDADFALTVHYNEGPERVLHFTVPTGYYTISNILGKTPPNMPGVETSTGVQVHRIHRSGVISACGHPKAWPGAMSDTNHTFDSYTFTACQSRCLQPILRTGVAGTNLSVSMYATPYASTNIPTDYVGDSGLSTNTEPFGVDVTGTTSYTIVVNDVDGNDPPNPYTLEIPTCALNCSVNQLPVAVVHDVRVVAEDYKGTAAASIDNGSFDPDGHAVTKTQSPPGPYGIGETKVMLTIVDTKGATVQAGATVTVLNPGFSLTGLEPFITVVAGQTATAHLRFVPNPGVLSPVTMRCAGAPAGSVCNFSPPTIPANGPLTDIVVTIKTPEFASANHVARKYQLTIGGSSTNIFEATHFTLMVK